MICIRDIKKEFVTGKKSFWALNGVSLEIGDGEFVAITGKSGSGKSTLLNIIGTLDAPTDGSVTIDGKNIASLSGKEIAMFRNRTVGFVFQSFYLEPGYTVYQNIELPLILAGRKGKQSKKLILEALNEVGLESKLNEKACNLSGGEQQRVALARAIVNNPRYILADEPCGNLDTQNSENIMRIFAHLHSEGKTIIMVSHDLIDVQKAQRIITMSDGKVIGDKSNKLKEAV